MNISDKYLVPTKVGPKIWQTSGPLFATQRLMTTVLMCRTIHSPFLTSSLPNFFGIESMILSFLAILVKWLRETVLKREGGRERGREGGREERERERERERESRNMKIKIEMFDKSPWNIDKIVQAKLKFNLRYILISSERMIRTLHLSDYRDLMENIH